MSPCDGLYCDEFLNTMSTRERRQGSPSSKAVARAYSKAFGRRRPPSHRDRLRPSCPTMPSRRADPRHGTPTGPPPPSQTDPRQQRWSRLAAWYVASRHLPCNGPNPPPPPPWSRLVRTHVREEGETGASPERYASQRTQTVQLNALSHSWGDSNLYSRWR